MPCAKTMGGNDAVALAIPPGNRIFLRRVVSAAQEGLREDLDRFGDQLPQARDVLLKEDAAYGALLEALDGRWIVPNSELRSVVSRFAESIDRDNEYARVVTEHDALCDLLDQLDWM